MKKKKSTDRLSWIVEEFNQQLENYLTLHDALLFADGTFPEYAITPLQNAYNSVYIAWLELQNQLITPEAKDLCKRTRQTMDGTQLFLPELPIDKADSIGSIGASRSYIKFDDIAIIIDSVGKTLTSALSNGDDSE